MSISKPKKFLILACFLIGKVSNLFGQVYTPGDELNPLDFINDSSSIHLHSSIQPVIASGIKVLDPLFISTFNTAYPRGYNDGPVWKGKGFTEELHFGLIEKIGDFQFTLSPVIYFSQNSSYQLQPQLINKGSVYRYQYASNIDYPQQFGANSFTSINWGQSEIKYEKGKFVSSISTQNYSLGPSRYNPILLSRQGAGFPHLRLGIRPVDIRLFNQFLGQLEFNYIGGILTESDYFDLNKKNDRRFFNGIFLALSPSITPGFTISFNKVLYENTQFFKVVDLLSPLTVLKSGVVGDSINTNDTFDGLASLTAEWKFPSIGFRAYGEFAKNDFTGGSRATFHEPEHSRAYSIGFEKLSDIGKGYSFYFGYEHTNLSRNHTYMWRAEPIFYVHNINKQGYTQKGQIIGAGIGPGSNSDIIILKLIKDRQSLIGTMQRIEFNKDYFVTQVMSRSKHDTEYSVGLQYQLQLEDYQFFLSSLLSINLGRYYQYYTKQENNYNFSLGVKKMIFANR